MNNQFKPILFSTPMVQAILDGRKTQTRRTKGLEKINENPDDWRYTNMTASDGERKEFFFKHRYYEGDDCSLLIPFPYGKVGDVLWVREKFRALVDCESGKFHSFSYYADMPEAFHKQFPHKWKPSIHMPKAACRLFLEITNVRVERLHDISEEDAKAEGVERLYEKTSNGVYYKEYGKDGGAFTTAYRSFLTLWESINGAESWNANPWVWVVEFKRIEKPVNF